MTDTQAKRAALRSAMRAYWRKQISGYRSQRNHAIALLESTKQVPMLQWIADGANPHKDEAIRHITERITVIEFAIETATEQLVAFSV